MEDESGDDDDDVRRYVGRGLRRAMASAAAEHCSQLEEGEGELMFQLMAAPPSAVNISGAVSPTTREMANRIPVKILPNEAGSITFNITRQ